jgi:hypothetical protein
VSSLILRIFRAESAHTFLKILQAGQGEVEDEAPVAAKAFGSSAFA